jgi:hypothetical protein
VRVAWCLSIVSMAACAPPNAGGVTPVPAPPVATGDTSGYSATVSRTQVRFVFPPVAQDSFEWWSPEARQQLVTYSWDVLVRSLADTAYSISSWLPAIGLEAYTRWYAETRQVPAGTQRGDLAALLEASMHTVSLLEGHMAIAIPRMRVDVGAEGQRVVLEVNDSRTIRRLFARRPSHVTFYTYLPGMLARVAHIAVTYLDH